MQILSSYQNGNAKVTLYDNGTKEIEWPDGQDFAPEMPNSIDLKITDYCNASCLFCHEKSTVNGKHGNLLNIFESVNDAIPGMEIAIGGGNPLDHPHFEDIIKYFYFRGFVPNLTVNARHIIRYKDRIINALKYGVYGMGISWFNNKAFFNALEEIRNDNFVIHMIMGVDKVEDAIRLAQNKYKILILGYKNYGRGMDYNEDTENIQNWKKSLNTLINQGSVISFDNLAIEQVDLKNRLKKEYWDEFYMGDDGSHTMYIDAVTDSFAVSSTKKRVQRNGKNLKEMFKVVKGN